MNYVCRLITDMKIYPILLISFKSADIIQLTRHNPCIVGAIGTHVVEMQMIQMKHISPSSDYGTL